MTLAEFKAWLEGFSASFDGGTPSAEQWAEVQRRLADVQPLIFAPYLPRPQDTMTRPLEVIRPYFVDSPTVQPEPLGVPVVTC